MKQFILISIGLIASLAQGIKLNQASTMDFQELLQSDGEATYSKAYIEGAKFGMLFSVLDLIGTN